MSLNNRCGSFHQASFFSGHLRLNTCDAQQELLNSHFGSLHKVVHRNAWVETKRAEMLSVTV